VYTFPRRLERRWTVHDAQARFCPFFAAKKAGHAIGLESQHIWSQLTFPRPLRARVEFVQVHSAGHLSAACFVGTELACSFFREMSKYELLVDSSA
jgi:hypothetical protein